VKRFFVPASVLLAIAACLVLGVPAAAGDITELVPGTAVLLDQSSGSGSGGNVKSTSSATNIFSPVAFVDYKRFGGEPTAVVDRYPFSNGTFRDTVYVSAPQGFVEQRHARRRNLHERRLLHG
jgi:nucleoid-associated protein YgaU